MAQPSSNSCFKNCDRYNLDPSETVTDEEVWNALERVNMKQPIKDMEKGLDSLIEGSGKCSSIVISYTCYYSHGNHQLIRIGEPSARAGSLHVYLSCCTLMSCFR